MHDTNEAFERMRDKQTQECSAILLAMNDPRVKETVQQLHTQARNDVEALGGTVNSEPRLDIYANAYSWSRDIDVTIKVDLSEIDGDYNLILDDDEAQFSFDVTHLKKHISRRQTLDYDGRITVAVSCSATVHAKIPKDDEILLFYTNHLQVKCYTPSSYRALVCNTE